MPPEHRTPVDMREVMARFADDSDFLDFKPDYGPATVCGHAAVQGFVLAVATLYVLINIAIDILYGIVDVRVRLGG